MKILLGLLATILTLSLSYYFVMALPAHNRAVLDFEREKYRIEQQETKAKAQEQKQRDNDADEKLQRCIALADINYSSNLRSNGTRNSSGGYSVPTEVLTVIDRQKTQALSECQKEYDRAIHARQ
jgi:hypothetical protein